MHAHAFQRVLGFSGSPNFRDMGGYATTDGRHISWRRLFRSGKLARLDDADLEGLERLGISTVVDLRSASERLDEPSCWRVPPGNVHHSFVTDTRDLSELVFSGGPDADIHRGMCRMYANIPTLFAADYRALLGFLADDPGPTLIHCTAGKDRTGVAAALVLTLLGVSAETVMADYCMTESLVDFEAKADAAEAPMGQGSQPGAQAALPLETRRILWRSHPDYLRATFDAIVQGYGTIDAYIGAALGVDAIMREKLRALYTDGGGPGA